MDLRDSVPGIVGVVRRGAVLISGFCAAIQRVIRVRRHLPFAIRDGGNIAVVVVGVVICTEQKVLAAVARLSERYGAEVSA